jgi:general secretion pathway protein A
MYTKFYNFKTKPFHIVPNPDILYPSSKHKTALTYLEYGLTEGLGFILFTGEIGTGKTTLIRFILRKITPKMEVAVVFNTNVNAEQLLGLVLNEFELQAVEGDKSRSLDILHEFLIGKYAQGQKVLLIIDEAQNLSDEALEEVRMLSNLQSDDQMLLQIMLVGQPELRTRLQQPHLAQLSQRIAVNYHLYPLTLEETRQYISFRLKKAACKRPIFTPEAIDLIFKASKGIPRSINLLCDSALVYGFADELKTIDKEILEQVIADKGGMGLGLEEQQTLETPSDTHLTETTDQNELFQRIKTLENTVQKIKLQVEWQIDQLEKMTSSFKDDLVNKLKEDILLERKRNELLLKKYLYFKEQYETLLNKEENLPLSSEDDNSTKAEETSVHQPGKWWNIKTWF